MSGSAGQLRVPVDFLRESLFPLAPLPEQRRIVERIDALFAEIADGEAALAEARKGLALFRRSLLKAAVTGELTRDWRGVNKPARTDAEGFGQLRQSKSASSWRPSSALPELPLGWNWCAISESPSGKSMKDCRASAA